MIPNDFGLIRQKEKNLLALPFLDLLGNLSEYHMEIIPSEWLSGYWNSAGVLTSSILHKRCTVDVSKYDFVIAPCEANGVGTVASGLTATAATSETFMAYVDLKPTSVRGFALFPVKSPFLPNDATYLKCTISVDSENLPIIGLMRHRSDNVNPKGMSKDAISDILQPIKANEFDGEADRERDDLSSDIEGPDVDTESSFGADERADS